jgi:ketosteroid isomerase-like protein
VLAARLGARALPLTRLFVRIGVRVPRSRLRYALMSRYIRVGFESFNQASATRLPRDFDVAVALLHPNVEWTDPSEFPGAGTHRGRSELRAFWEEFLEAWTECRMDAEEIIDLGGPRAVVAVRWSSRGRASGAELKLRFFQVWVIRAGLPAHVGGYMDEAEALKAARG